MPMPVKIVCAMLVFGLMHCKAQSAVEQSDQPNAAASNPDTMSALAVTGQPFSAIKYTRTVKIMPDGKRVIKTERYSILLARDAEGRVRVEGASPPVECEQPGLLVPLKCAYANIFVFDPMARTMTHWGEGEIAAHEAAIIQVSASQFEEAERLTLTVEKNAYETDGEEREVIRENLGQKEIEGVSATGVRWSTAIPTGVPGQKATITHIHEVWTATEMQMVIKVIDGDPRDEETISGLEHITRAPDPSLFHPPEGYAIYDWKTSRWIHSNGANGGIRGLAEWQVK